MKKFLILPLLIFTFLVIAPEASAVATCTDGELVGGVCVPNNTGLSDKSVYKVLTTLVEWITYIFASIAIIIFVICGLKYLTSVGDDTSAGEAKKCMTYAIIGIVVAGGAFIILKTVANILNGNAF